MALMIVIPTYNERDNIIKIIPEIFALQLPLPVEITIVDDNSPDGTGEICDEIAKKEPRVKVIHRPKKMGLGTAYIEGFKYALNKKYIRYIMEMDADFSHNPQKIPEFVEMMKDYDVVIGSRYINGISVVNWPLRRLAYSLLANIYARTITGLKLTDVTTGFKCFRREVLEAIDLDKVQSDGYAFQIEMNYRAMKLGFKFKEIPIIFVDRHAGTSKLDRKIVREAFFLVWRLRLGLYKH